MADVQKVTERPLDESGITPVEYKVLIKVDEVEEVTEGGLYIPQQAMEKEQISQERGTLLKVGGNAFEEWTGPKPQPGDRVLFEKYGGKLIEGRQELRICNDKDITAILEGQ